MSTQNSANADWLPTSSHWGAYRAGVTADGGIGIEPHPADPAPSPLLGNVAGSAQHATRVRRPAVRRGWLERGPGPSSGRGREEFVEVDWETALDAVAGQLDLVRNQHGNEAIYGGSYGWSSAGRFHHAQSQLRRFLNTIGGYTSARGNYSFGASDVLLRHVLGGSHVVLGNADSWETIREHTDLLVAFGGLAVKNVSVSPGGVAQHTGTTALGDLGGTELAVFTPLADDVPDTAGAVQHSIEPGSDVAVLLALAHVLLREGLHDADFLRRYCSGADEFTDYVLGTSDGAPKTPEWAAQLSGADPDGLRELARRMAAGRTLITISWSLQRTEHGEQPVWAGLALAALLGQIGLPGGGFGHGYGSMADVGSSGPVLGLPSLPQGKNPVPTFIPVTRISDMLLDPGGTCEYDGQQLTYPDVRLVYWVGGNPFHHHQDLTRLRRAFARPDTVVVHETHWTATARHADVVLPATTTLEREDIGAGRRDTRLIAMHRITDPIGQARDDHRIFADLAERLGTRAQFTEGRSPRGWLEHLYEQWRTGLGKQGFEVPEFDRFFADGELTLPDPAQPAPLPRFRADPDGSPLATPSGRIELHSPEIAGFGYPDCPGHPAWLEPEHPRGGPLHLIAHQPRHRLHAQGDVGELSQSTKISGREPARISPSDAAERGVQHGDVVRLVNDRGACLAGAHVDERVRPGVVVLPTGAWFDPVDDPRRPGSTLCVHGNPNVLTADLPTSRLSHGCAGQHAFVDLHRYDDPLPEVSYLRPPRGVRDPGAEQ